MPDEPLLADGEVHFQGMPIAIVLAETEELARARREEDHGRDRAARIVTDPRVAAAKDD